MKKRKHLVLLMGVFVYFLFGLVSNCKVSALTCNNVTAAMNSSVYQACHQYSSGSPVGTMWISSSSDSKNLNTSIETNQSSGEITVYLHGAIIGGEDATADYVKFSSRNFVSEEYNSVSDYAPLSTLDGNRRFVRKGNLNPGQNDIVSSVVALKLSIDKLVEIENSYVPEGENYRRYAVELYGFRCFQGKTPFNNPRDCWANRSDITVKIPQASIQGRTGVVLSGKSSQSSTTWQSSNSEAETLFANNCENGCTFVFSHELRVKKSGNGTIKYEVRKESNIEKPDKRSDGTLNYNGAKDYSVETIEKKLYPGETYCTTMTFPTGLGSKKASTKVCAGATGKLSSDVDAKARRWAGGVMTNGAMKEGDKLYAKPGEVITLLAYYNANAQKAGSLYYSTMKFVENGKESAVYSSTSRVLSSLFNDYSGVYGQGIPTWRNAFTMTHTGPFASQNETSDKFFSLNKSCNKNQTKREEDWTCVEDVFKNGKPTIQQDQVGKVEGVVVGLNSKNTVKTTPRSVEFYSYDALKTTGKDLILGSAMDNNLVLSYGGAVANGANVLTRNKESAAVKKWVLLPVTGESDYYYIADFGNNEYVLDVAAGATNDGANVQLYKNNNTSAQKWKLERTGAGLYMIVSKLTRKENGKTVRLVLDVEGAGSGGVTNVRIWHEDATRTKEQRWNISRRQYLVAKVGIDSKKKAAQVLIPYNFNNTITITNRESVFKDGKIVLDEVLKYNINVGERENSKVGGGGYATIVRKASHGIRWCEAADGQTGWNKEKRPLTSKKGSSYRCKEGEGVSEIKGKTGLKFNPGGNSGSYSLERIESLASGKRICLQAWVSPGNSENDEKMDEKWTSFSYSESFCGVVTKREKTGSVGVFGGGVFLDGTFDNAGFAQWGVFRSVKTGEVFDDNKFLSRSNLSLNAESKFGVNDNKEVIRDYYSDLCSEVSPVDNGSAGVMVASESQVSLQKSNKDENVYCFNTNQTSIKLNEVSGLGKNETLVILGDGANVVIAGNLTYDENETYRTMDEVPKMVIDAEAIEIKSNVGRVDGLLIADRVNTCALSDGQSSEECEGAQLVINGAVVTGTLGEGRSYGDSGDNPAVKINFDPSLYLLKSYAKFSNNNTFRAINTVELAPRY